MPRRIADLHRCIEFLNNPAIIGMNQFMTYSAFALGLTQILFAFNFLYSLVAGPKASANPWHANTLEWAAPSPPPHYNFEVIPTVYHAAYEYSVPGHADRLPAPDRAAAAAGRPARPGHGLSRPHGPSNRPARPATTATATQPPDPGRYRRGPHWVAVFAAVFTWPLIFVGGLVTTYRVGMAVPDWPTTFGMNMFLYRLLGGRLRRLRRAQRTGSTARRSGWRRSS